jgi:hypothetical protein
MSTFATTSPLARSAIIDLNLLPREHRPAQVSGLALAVGAFLVLCLVAAIPLAFRMEAARDRATEASTLLEGARFELRGVEVELARRRVLQVEAETASAEALRLQGERAFLQRGTRPLAEDLFWLYGLNFLPAGARITTIGPTEEGFRVEGTAAGPLDGISYAEKLVSVGGFPSARMAAFTPGQSGGGLFTVEVRR